MARMSGHYQSLVRLGAQARLHELDRERAELMKVLSGMPKGNGRLVAANGAVGKPKRQFSAAARRRISAGMRKLWAKRKAAAKAGAA